jgi:putative heme iron utilization protein
MADPITPEVSQRICAHMNDDHAEAVLLYAKVYGKAEDAIAASMTAIDPEGMDLSVTLSGEATSLRIPFERHLTDSEDAHQTLIGMVRQARSQAS